MYWGIQHIIGHAAYMGTYITDMDMQHGHFFGAISVQGQKSHAKLL